jgi:hypothetical protein
MKKVFKHKKKQSGFVGPLFVAILLIAVVMGAMAKMSRNSTTGVTDQGAKTNAAVLMKQSSDFKAGFDRLLTTGTVTATQITFDTNATTGLFNPTPGAQYAVLHTPPAGVAQSGTPAYTYNPNIKLPSIGSNSAADGVVVVGNISLAVCNQINTQLYNDAATNTPATSTGSSASWTGTAAIDDSGLTTNGNFYNGRPEGCVKTSDGQYVYYKALNEV